MGKAIVAAIAVSRISIQLDRVDYTLGELSLLMSHAEFLQVLEGEIHQLENDNNQDGIAGLNPTTLVSVLRRRLSRSTDESTIELDWKNRGHRYKKI